MLLSLSSRICFFASPQVTSHDVNRAVTTVREVLEEAGVKPDPLGGLSAVTVTEVSRAVPCVHGMSTKGSACPIVFTHGGI